MRPSLGGLAFGWFGTSNATVIARLPHFGQRNRFDRASSGRRWPRVHTSVFMSSSVVVSHQIDLRSRVFGLRPTRRQWTRMRQPSFQASPRALTSMLPWIEELRKHSPSLRWPIFVALVIGVTGGFGAGIYLWGGTASTRRERVALLGGGRGHAPLRIIEVKSGPSYRIKPDDDVIQ